MCREFVLLCRRLKLFAEAIVAIDGSKFKAVNNRDKNFTPAQAPGAHAAARGEHQRATWPNSTAPIAIRRRGPEARVEHLKEKIAKVKEQMQRAR